MWIDELPTPLLWFKTDTPTASRPKMACLTSNDVTVWREFAREYEAFAGEGNYAATMSACEVCADNITMQVKRRDRYLYDTEVFTWKLPHPRP